MCLNESVSRKVVNFGAAGNQVNDHFRRKRLKGKYLCYTWNCSLKFALGKHALAQLAQRTEILLIRPKRRIENTLHSKPEAFDEKPAVKLSVCNAITQNKNSLGRYLTLRVDLHPGLQIWYHAIWKSYMTNQKILWSLNPELLASAYHALQF